MNRRMHFWERYRSCICLIFIALTASLMGCNGNISPEILRTCDRGVKVPAGCENPSSCSADGDCLEGFYCGDGVCKETIDCSPSVAPDHDAQVKLCGRGKCQNVKVGADERWLCVNPPSCEPKNPLQGCIPGDYCTDENKCAHPSVSCDDCKNGHGVCTKNGCENPASCSNDEQCKHGFECADDGTCVSSADACQATSSARGKCDRKKRKYVNIEPCSSWKDCLEGSHCGTGKLCEKDACTDGPSGDSKCHANGMPGGVCLHGECTDKVDCTKDSECLNGKVCAKVGGVAQCVEEKDKCGSVCSGSQTCEADSSTPPTYTCKSATTCETSLDCVVGEYCKEHGKPCESDSSSCSHPSVDETYSAALDRTICGGSKDSFVYQKQASGTVSIQAVVTLVGEHVGKGPVTIHFMDEMGKNELHMSTPVSDTVVGDKEFISGVVSTSETSIRVNVQSGNDKIGEGLAYHLDIIEVPEDTVNACKSASEISSNFSASYDYSGTTKIYKVVVDKDGFYQFSAAPLSGGGSAPMSLVLLSDCFQKSSQVLHEEGKTPSDTVRMEGLLAKGTYFLKVDAGNTNMRYILDVHSHEKECALNYQKCTSATDLNYCTKDYKIATKTCSCSNDRCEEEQGFDCLNAIEVNAGNIDQFDKKQYDFTTLKVKNGWGAIQANNVCQGAYFSQYDDQPDFSFKVTIPPNKAIKGLINPVDSDHDVEVLVLKDKTGVCGGAHQCLSVSDEKAFGRSPENFFYYNPSMTDSLEVYVVVKIRHRPAVSNAGGLQVHMQFVDKLCDANEYSCYLGRELRKCDALGGAFEETTQCPAKGGCVDEKVENGITVPAHCALSPGDTCSNAIELKNNDTLKGETFRYDAKERSYQGDTNHGLSTCLYTGMNHVDGLKYGRDNVYRLNMKTGEVAKITVTPENRLVDPFIWVAKQPCVDKSGAMPPDYKNLTCMAAANAYALVPYAQEKPEVLTFKAERDGDYYVFVSEYPHDTLPEDGGLYSISANIYKNQECDLKKDFPSCKGGKLSFCDDNGVFHEITCENGCDDGKAWCKKTSHPNVEGALCEYPIVVPDMPSQGTIVGEIEDQPYDMSTSSPYPGRMMAMGTGKNYEFRGECYLKYIKPGASILSNRRIYAFTVHSGQTLSISSLYTASSDSIAYLSDQCYAQDSCLAIQTQTKQHDFVYHNADPSSKVIYFTVMGNGAYAYRWSLRSVTGKCSYADSTCDGNKVIKCLNGGVESIDLECPSVGSTSTSCTHDFCDFSTVTNWGTCTSPTDLKKGSIFFYDAKDVTNKGSVDHSCTTNSDVENVRKTYYRVTAKAGDHIRGRVHRMAYDQSNQYFSYGLYVLKDANTSCDECATNGASFDLEHPSTGVDLDYDVPKDGKYTVVLVSKDGDYLSPAKVEIYVEPQQTISSSSCSTNGEMMCGNLDGRSFVKMCENGRWERIMSCVSNSCSSGQCSDRDGDTPDTPIVLTASYTNQVENVDLSGARNTTDVLSHNGFLYGGCLLGILEESSEKYQYGNGPDRYYEVTMQAGETLFASLKGTSMGNLSLYLLDVDHRTCITSDPHFKASAGPVTRSLVFRAAKAGKYLIVVDSQVGSKPELKPVFKTGDITLSYRVEAAGYDKSLKKDDYLRDCEDANTLVTWSPQEDRSQVTSSTTWKENKVTCPDGCVGGTCVAGMHADTVAEADKNTIKPPFAVSFNPTRGGLTSDADVSSFCFTSSSNLYYVEPKQPDAFYKVELEPYQRLNIFMRSLLIYASPVSYLFKNKNDVDGTCQKGGFIQLGDKEQGFTPYFSDLLDTYRAGAKKETIYIGFDMVYDISSSNPDDGRALFYVDVVNPECTPGVTANKCSNNDLAYCASDATMKTFECKDTSGHTEACVSGSCPHPSGMLCADAIPADLVVNPKFTDSNVLAGKKDTFDYPLSSSFYTDGEDVVYRVKVPANQKITLTLTSNESTPEDLSLYILKDCGQASLDHTLYYTTTSGTLMQDYTGGASDSVIYVVVDSDSYAQGKYTLSIAK